MVRRHIMKKSSSYASFLAVAGFTILALAVLLFSSSCESTSSAAAGAKLEEKTAVSLPERDTAQKEDLVFALGNDVSKFFTGTVYLNNLIKKDSVYNFPATNTVTFAPGSRSGWHVHGGMEILVVGGKGYYQEEGKKAQIIRKGDVVHIPAGTRHWHGAAPDSWFQQIVIYDADWKNPDSNPKPEESVSDEAYKNLEAEEYSGRTVTSADTFMFGNGKTYSFPTFSGPVNLSDTLGEPNEAGAPGLHNVVFGKGVYNNWHSHEGGQILIVTDGTGYHQVEGGKVEVLHAGDVAFCPPGVMHWHGATAASSFAHLAANTNPEKTGLVWGGRLFESEYEKLPQN